MSLSTPDQPSARQHDHPDEDGPGEGRAVLCPKCEHLNRSGSTCRKCGAHLYVACVGCGGKNERVRTRCRDCGRRLHRSLLDQTFSRFRKKKLKVNPVSIVLFIIVVGMAYKMIQFFAQMPGE